MRAANRFAAQLQQEDLLAQTRSISVCFYGSLGATGKGHASDRAVIGGLSGDAPETVDPQALADRVQQVVQTRRLQLADGPSIEFDYKRDLEFSGKCLPEHSNAMNIVARDEAAHTLLDRTYFSVGGGFVIEKGAAEQPPLEEYPIPYPFDSGQQLIELCQHHGCTISELMLANELARQGGQPDGVAVIRTRLLSLWNIMQRCIENGCRHEGVLPGGLNVQRRAPLLFRKLLHESPSMRIALASLDWVDLWALAVNEENAAGGRIVTAPTNGAAGVVPAVLQYYHHFLPDANQEGTVRFLLAAAAVGSLFKQNASISGAEVGCQGEIGSACSMAAAGLAEVMGGTIHQVENAAEIGMEHHLGLTCDPIGGLVQIPCIERNAMAAVQAINSARLALRGDGRHYVSLDKVIKTMLETGRDMQSKYKETSRGGLAVNVPEC